MPMSIRVRNRVTAKVRNMATFRTRVTIRVRPALAFVRRGGTTREYLPAPPKSER